MLQIYGVRFFQCYMYIKLYIIFCSGFKSLAILILVLLCMFENAKHQKGLKTLTILDKLDLGLRNTLLSKLLLVINTHIYLITKQSI